MTRKDSIAVKKRKQAQSNHVTEQAVAAAVVVVARAVEKQGDAVRVFAEKYKH